MAKFSLQNIYLLGCYISGGGYCLTPDNHNIMKRPDTLEVRYILTHVHDRIMNGNPVYLQELEKLNKRFKGKYIEKDGVFVDRRILAQK